MKYEIGELQMLVLNNFAFRNAKGQSKANSQTLAISDYTLKKKKDTSQKVSFFCTYNQRDFYIPNA